MEVLMGTPDAVTHVISNRLGFLSVQILLQMSGYNAQFPTLIWNLILSALCPVPLWRGKGLPEPWALTLKGASPEGPGIQVAGPKEARGQQVSRRQ